jgi:hypothetical protein
MVRRYRFVRNGGAYIDAMVHEMVTSFCLFTLSLLALLVTLNDHSWHNKDNNNGRHQTP